MAAPNRLRRRRLPLMPSRVRSGRSERRAKDSKRDDIVRLHVLGQVVSVTPIADSKLTKIVLAIEDSGVRNMRGEIIEHRANNLQFTDDGYVLKLICKPNRIFHTYDDSGDDDNGGQEPESPSPSDSGVEKEPAINE